MKYKNVRCMDTKELILEKTLKLMIEKQNSLLSIREISEATGIATGGIYHYFSNKKQIYDELIEKYYINYVKLNLDKLMLIKGNAKEKIHDVMTEIFKQYQSRIIIKTTEDEIDYRTILFILTPIITRYENSWECYHGIIKELNDILTEIVEEGQKNRQIRQDISSEDIAGSLIILFTGIEYKWELYFIDDMVSEFENQFKLEWEKIKFRE